MRRLSLVVPLIFASAALLAAADGVKPDKEDRPDKADKPDKATKAERREMRKAGDGGASDEKRPASADPQARAQSRLRERLEITDDGEWAVILERIQRVEELRRTVAGAPASGADRGKRSSRSEGVAAEREALRSAVADHLPDAEIRARLARVAEVNRQNQAKLARAQEELRAVLTVRQEAIAVVFGLLPP